MGGVGDRVDRGYGGVGSRVDRSIEDGAIGGFETGVDGMV